MVRKRGRIVTGFYRDSHGVVRPITNKRPKTTHNGKGRMSRPVKARYLHDSTTSKNIHSYQERSQINLREPWEVNYAVRSGTIQKERKR